MLCGISVWNAWTARLWPRVGWVLLMQPFQRARDRRRVGGCGLIEPLSKTSVGPCWSYLAVHCATPCSCRLRSRSKTWARAGQRSMKNVSRKKNERMAMPTRTTRVTSLEKLTTLEDNFLIMTVHKLVSCRVQSSTFRGFYYFAKVEEV